MMMMWLQINSNQYTLHMGVDWLMLTRKIKNVYYSIVLLIKLYCIVILREVLFLLLRIYRIKNFAKINGVYVNTHICNGESITGWLV